MTIVNMVGGGASSTKYAKIPTTKRIGQFRFSSNVGVTSYSGTLYRWSPFNATEGYISLFSDESGDYAARINPQSSTSTSRNQYKMSSGSNGSIIWDPDFKAEIESKVQNLDATLRVGASSYYNTNTQPTMSVVFKVVNGVLQDTSTSINGYYTSDSIIRSGDRWELFTVTTYLDNLTKLELK